MSQFSSIATCFGHVVLAAVTGWSLKYLPSPTAGVPAVWLLLYCLLAYSALGIVRYSHPQPGKLLRLLYDQAALLAKVGPLPLLNVQLYLEPNEAHHNFALPYRTELGYAFALSALGALVACHAFSDLSRRHIGEHIATGVLLMNAAGLSVVACGSDNYWAMGLVVSFVSKHFLLPVLAERYRIPSALLYTYGLCFYEIFTVNAVADVQAAATIRVIM